MRNGSFLFLAIITGLLTVACTKKDANSDGLLGKYAIPGFAHLGDNSKGATLTPSPIPGPKPLGITTASPPRPRPQVEVSAKGAIAAAPMRVATLQKSPAPSIHRKRKHHAKKAAHKKRRHARHGSRHKRRRH